MRVDERVSVFAPAVAGEVTLTNLAGQSTIFRASEISAVEALVADARSPVFTGDKCRVYFDAHMMSIRGTAAATKTLIDASVAAYPTNYVQVEEQQAIGVNGGSFTLGAFRTRNLNTEVSDDDNLASVATNQVTLQPGDWVISGQAIARGVARHQTRLQNISTATQVKLGTAERATNAVEIQSVSFVTARVSFAVATIFELQHRCSTNNSTTGFGAAAGYDTEVYAIFTARKLAEA